MESSQSTETGLHDELMSDSGMRVLKTRVQQDYANATMFAGSLERVHQLRKLTHALVMRAISECAVRATSPPLRHRLECLSRAKAKVETNSNKERTLQIADRRTQTVRGESVRLQEVTSNSSQEEHVFKTAES